MLLPTSVSTMARIKTLHRFVVHLAAVGQIELVPMTIAIKQARAENKNRSSSDGNLRPTNVRFGSKADVTLLNLDVRFTPESGHGSAG
jgi:hypothetical protein